MPVEVEKMKEFLAVAATKEFAEKLTPGDIDVIIKTMSVALEMTEQMKRHGDDPLRSQIWIDRIRPVLEKLKRIFL